MKNILIGFITMVMSLFAMGQKPQQLVITPDTVVTTVQFENPTLSKRDRTVDAAIIEWLSKANGTNVTVAEFLNKLDQHIMEFNVNTKELLTPPPEVSIGTRIANEIENVPPLLFNPVRKKRIIQIAFTLLGLLWAALGYVTAISSTPNRMNVGIVLLRRSTVILLAFTTAYLGGWITNMLINPEYYHIKELIELIK